MDERARNLALGTRSELYRRALELIPGGVNSPVRAMRAVGLDEPVFMRRGEGAYIEDVDGRRYVDWVMSWGPLLFGHADRETVDAVIAAAQDGTTSGPVSVDGNGGAKYFGFYGTGGATISTITVTTPDTLGFAIGEFGISPAAVVIL